MNCQIEGKKRVLELEVQISKSEKLKGHQGFFTRKLINLFNFTNLTFKELLQDLQKSQTIIHHFLYIETSGGSWDGNYVCLEKVTIDFG